MEMLELLEKAGLPRDLMRDLGGVLQHPELQGLWEVFTTDPTRRVIFIYGNPTPKKEMLCAVLVRSLMEHRKKKGLWLTPTKVPATQWGEGSAPFPPTGVTAVVGMDMLSQQQVRILVGWIRDQIPENKVFIIEVSSKAALEEIVGKVAMQYLSGYAVALEVVDKDTPVVTLKVKQ